MTYMTYVTYQYFILFGFVMLVGLLGLCASVMSETLPFQKRAKAKERRFGQAFSNLRIQAQRMDYTHNDKSGLTSLEKSQALEPAS